MPPTDRPEAEASPAADSWDGVLNNLRTRYPGQKDSVLYCIFKLQQNPDITLPDFREEAALHGIPAAGRALHSAKVLLGLAQAKPRQPRSPADDAAGARPSGTASTAKVPTSKVPASRASGAQRRRAGSDDDGGADLESKVLDAVQRLRSSAAADAERLRAAIREAIAVLQDALDA